MVNKPINSLARLYKYYDFEGLKKTLEGQSILLKKPSEFNDPFDMKLNPEPPLSGAEMRDILTQRLAKAAIGGTLHREIQDRTGRKLPDLVSRQQKRKFVQSLRPQKLLRITNGRDIAKGFDQIYRGTNADIQVALDHSHLFCMTEHKSDLLMWSHYADEHKGAVLEFRKLPKGRFSFINAARRVKYSEVPPKLGTPESWRARLEKGEPIQPEDLDIYSVVTTKSVDWEYESEWRLVIMPTDLDEIPMRGPRGLYRFDVDAVGAIYFGCRMPKVQREQIVTLCRSKYPTAKLFESVQARDSFQMGFHEIKM